MNMLSWIVDGSFSTRLTMALLHFLWQGCVGGIIVIVGGWLLRKATPRTRYSFNVMAIFLLAACLPATFVLVGRPVASSDRSFPIQVVHDSPVPPLSHVEFFDSVTEVRFPVGQDKVSSLQSLVKPNPSTETGTLDAEAGSIQVSSAGWFPSIRSAFHSNGISTLSQWVTPLYLTCVALILGRLLVGVKGGHRLRRMAEEIHDADLLGRVAKLAGRLGLKVVPIVAWCEQISIPVVVGVVKPMILLPMGIVSGLTADQLQALILHELSHIQRYDPVVNLLQRIIEAVLFFHPVVWLVSRRISIERELAADDMVLAAGWDRPHYADALVRVAELALSISGKDLVSRATVLGASGTNSSEFKLRILRLLGESHPPKLDISRSGIVVTLLFIAMGGALAWSQTGKDKTTDGRSSSPEATNSEPTQTPVAAEPNEQFASIQTSQPLAKELGPFDGTWAVDSIESESTTLKIPYPRQRWRWTINGNEITWGREGEQWKLNAKLNPSTTPKQIDLTFLDGPHKGETALGIYERDGKDGKSLKILMRDPGAKADRPTRFARKAGSQTSLIALHAIPPIDPVKELASFQGTWCWELSQPWTWPRPIGIGTDSDGRQSERRWVIEGNRITWVGQDGQRVYVSFTINPFMTPKQIEFTFLNGPLTGKKSIGIYEPANGDEKILSLCMTDPGSDAPRPIDISADSTKKQSIIAIHKVDPPKPAVAKELEPFQGFWHMALCDTVNETLYLSNDELPKRTWRVKGNQIVWSQKGEEWRLQLRVDPNKSPKEFDLTYLSGPFAGKTCLGMYEFGGVNNQVLHIAIQDPGANVPRPDKLQMTGSSKTGLIYLSPIEMSEAERDFASFQGTWTLRNFVTGKFDRNKDSSSWPLPKGKGPDRSGAGSELRWVVKGKEITWTSQAGEEIKASFTIDPIKRPKQIDLKFLSGPHQGETCLGIYQRDDLDENILWLCMADPGSKKVRPKEFSYKWGEGRSVLSLYPFEPPEPSNPKSSTGSQPKPMPSAEPVPARPKAGLGRESFKGRVMIDGATPQVPPIKLQPGLSLVIPRNDEDKRRNEKAKRDTPVVEIPDDSMVISKEGGLANVAIYLKKAPESWKPSAPPETPVELRSSDNRFQPRVSFLRVGQPLRLIAPKNEADNLYVQSLRSTPFNRLLMPNSTVDVAKPFDKSERGPIAVGSNLHPWQRAWLFAFDHPFVAITDTDGRFEIRDLPAGEHHFTIWHERRGYLNKDLIVRVEEGKVTAVDLKYTVEQLLPGEVAPPIQKPDDKPNADAKRAGSGSPDPALDPTAGLSDSKNDTKTTVRDAAAATDANLMAKELASFQGSWCFDALQIADWPQPIGIGTDSNGLKSEKRMVVKGNQIAWTDRQGNPITAEFTIDPFKSPRQIDFTFIRGPQRGLKSRGIYEPQKGNADYRWLCMTHLGSDAPRPTDFSAGDSKKQSIIFVHRVAPPSKPSMAKELQRLQGVWKMTLCDSTLRTFGATQKEIENWQWTIKGDEILWRRGSDEWKLKLEIAPPKNPRVMDLTYLAAPFDLDLTFLSGPFQGAKCGGIFGWGGVDGESLMIAIQDPGSDAPRPTRFHMNSAVKTGLMILRPSKPTDTEREIGALQGTWTLRNFDTGNFDRNKDQSSWPLPGGKGPDKSGEGSEFRWTIKGREIAWTSPSGQEIKASFTIDSRQHPKQIDLTFLSGPHKGEACPGIFQRGDLDEKILWLCLADPGSTKVRPKEFSYQWGQGKSMLSFYPFGSSTAAGADTRQKP